MGLTKAERDLRAAEKAAAEAEIEIAEAAPTSAAEAALTPMVYVEDETADTEEQRVLRERYPERPYAEAVSEQHRVVLENAGLPVA